MQWVVNTGALASHSIDSLSTYYHQAAFFNEFSLTSPGIPQDLFGKVFHHTMDNSFTRSFTISPVCQFQTTSWFSLRELKNLGPWKRRDMCFYICSTVGQTERIDSSSILSSKLFFCPTTSAFFQPSLRHKWIFISTLGLPWSFASYSSETPLRHSCYCQHGRDRTREHRCCGLGTTVWRKLSSCQLHRELQKSDITSAEKQMALHYSEQKCDQFYPSAEL